MQVIPMMKRASVQARSSYRRLTEIPEFPEFSSGVLFAIRDFLRSQGAPGPVETGPGGRSSKSGVPESPESF